MVNKRNHQNISEIRSLIGKYGDNANIHLGGIPMIADDMMSFIKNDILDSHNLEEIFKYIEY